MLIPVAPQFRRRRGRTKRAGPGQGPMPPAALVLASAIYDSEAGALTLGFDRPINLAGYDGTQIIVDDNMTWGNRYAGGAGPQLIDPSTVRIMLTMVDPCVGSGVRLTATALSGIVAADDGGAWAGVTDLLLPFS